MFNYYDFFVHIGKQHPIGFICHGHSLKEFPKYRGRLLKHNIFWGSLNQYHIAEKALGRKLDFIVSYSGHYDIRGNLVLKNAPNRGYSSLHEFLLFCIYCEVRQVLLFGADGYSDDNQSIYYGVDDKKVFYQNHKHDTGVFNREFPKDTWKTEIINCSPGSKYTAVRNVTYKELLGELCDI